MTIRGTERVDERTAKSAALLMALAWPGYDSLFLREIQAYQSNPDLFLPYFAQAEYDGDVAGFSVLTASMMSTDLDTISWVAVQPGHRGCGIGTRLVGMCVQEARRRGRAVVLSTTVPEFYIKTGFRQAGAYDAAKKHFLMTTA